MNAIRGFFGDYRFLSNFYPVEIDYNFIVYPSVEHAYQASKTYSVRHKLMIADTPRPGDAKRLGKTLEIAKGWEEHKLTIMYDLNKLKFTQLAFKPRLLATGDAELVETNAWGDIFWGEC